MKTAKYQKRCFDQIQGISKDNKALTAEVDRLRKRLETVERGQTEVKS
jgi:regulator of replication initiation timing